MHAHQAIADILHRRGIGRRRQRSLLRFQASKARRFIRNQVSAAEFVLVEQLDRVGGLHQRVARGMCAQYV